MRTLRTLVWALLFVMAAASTNAYGQVIDTIIPNKYHYQVFNNWCGSASIEMMLDCPAVTGANATLATMLAAPDDTAVGQFGARPTPTIVGGQVTANPQAFIYGLNHGQNTVNGVEYNNPYVPYGSGSDSNGVLADLQLLDNPNFVGQGTHAYSGFNLIPTLAGATVATRTIANCLKDYSVPAQIVVESGAHSIIANGVETTGTPGIGQQYTINYVQVSDPWTGYAIQRINAGDPASAAGTLGLGFNTWLRYGYDILGNGQGIAIQLPNGNIVPNARPGAWFNYFNVSPAQSSLGFTAPGYKFTVEPQGPESLDTGDGLNDGSLPTPPPLLGSAENASQAQASALSDLGNDGQLSGNMALMGSGGHLDSALGDETLLQMPGGQGDGDWLIPYDGGGGANDVTGALLIDADTGVIDQATWLDPTDNLPGGYTLSQLDQMFADEAAGVTPSDNIVTAPEPGTLSLLIIAGLMAPIGYVVRRRRLA